MLTDPSMLLHWDVGADISIGIKQQTTRTSWRPETLQNGQGVWEKVAWDLRKDSLIVCEEKSTLLYQLLIH